MKKFDMLIVIKGTRLKFDMPNECFIYIRLFSYAQIKIVKKSRRSTNLKSIDYPKFQKDVPNMA